MRYKLVIITAVLLSGFASCKKDVASNWAGTYNGTSGNNTVQRVVINKVNNETIRLDLQTQFLNSFVTFATITNGKVTNTSLSVNEDGTVSGNNGTYHFSGSGTRDGNTITISGTATQQGASTLAYVFVGSK